MDIALRAAFESLQGYRFAFQRGYADLLYLNILETQTNVIEIDLIDAQRDWFVALAQMQAALGLDPLEQALYIAEIPDSTRPGPGDMPLDIQPVPEGFDADWEKHLLTERDRLAAAGGRVALGRLPAR